MLIGLVPPLVLGALISALVARNASAHAALLAGLVGLAMLLEAGAYVASDGTYARNASRLYRNVRLQMFHGALRRRTVVGAEQTAGLPSRFISDSETLERMTLALLDRGLMQIVEFVGAMTALAALSRGRSPSWCRRWPEPGSSPGASNSQRPSPASGAKSSSKR